ncbi:TPA: Abi family protein, partial [Streptococcus pyogenes]
NSPFYNALHTKYSIRPDDSRKNVYSIFLSLQCFLSKIEYAKLHNSIRKRVNQLTNKIGQEKVNEILLYLGFPELWNQLSKLSQ